MGWGRKTPAPDKPRWSQDDYHIDFAGKIKAQIPLGMSC